jgi:tetratricopeptide (TPR) repeat protein
VIINLNPTRYFPLRRQFAELLFQLYPQENVGPLAKFYCDNVQISNAIPKASYAFLSEVQPNGESDDMQACATIGCLLYDLGVPEEAQKFAERSIHFKNPPVQAYLTRACSLIDNHQYEEAIDMIKLGLKLDPKQDRFYYNLALVYLDLDRPEDAEQAAKSGIAISRYPVDLQVQLLRAYVRNGKFVDALPLVRAIADIDPDLLLSTIKFPEFELFREMLPVKTILDECAYHRPE